MALGTFQPVGTAAKDARVTQINGNTNYATDIYWQGGYRPANGDIHRYYYQFDLSSIAFATVSSGTYSLYIEGQNEGPFVTTTLDVHNVTGTWSQSLITYNNQPAFATSVVVSNTIAGTFVGWADFSIGTLIQQWVNGTNNGMVIKGTNEAAGNSFYGPSADRGGTIVPKLIVNYSPFVPPTGFVSYRNLLGVGF